MKHDLGELTRAHYERYPYPLYEVIDWTPQELAKVNYFTGRGGDAPVRADAKVLIAGCGTREAAMWGLSMPAAQITGVDFSARSLAQARTLVDALCLDNVRLEQADIMSLDLEHLGGPFDLVVSFGVVHHLRDPATGLRQLRKALKPDGVILLMVYSTTHRAPVRALDRVASLMAGTSASAEQRVTLLEELSARCGHIPGPLQESLQMVGEQGRSNRPALMDTFAHPNYHTYSIPELLELLGSCGLRHLSWARPGDWEITSYLQEGVALEQIEALAPPERWELIDRLFAPLFILYAERADRPVLSGPLPYDADDETLLDAVPAPSIRYRIALGADGELSEPEPYGPTVKLRKGSLAVEFLPGYQYEDDPALGAVLQQMNGRRTLRQCVTAAAALAGIESERLKEIATRGVRALLSPHEAVVMLSTGAAGGRHE